MKSTVGGFLLACVAMLCAGPVLAQYVRGNEAVTSSGVRQIVETPPIQGRAGKLCSADDPCHAGVWRMVQTDAGLVECTEEYARQGTCRASTYGTQKLRRLWVVKHRGLWLQCQYPDLASHCVDMNATPPQNVPMDAVQ
jgi:hypothetical protein